MRGIRGKNAIAPNDKCARTQLAMESLEMRNAGLDISIISKAAALPGLFTFVKTNSEHITATSIDPHPRADDVTEAIGAAFSSKD